MTQATDLGAIPNQSRTLYRGRVNTNIQALATFNSGPAEPSQVYPFMFWWDTTNDKVKQRNEPNTAWQTVGDTNPDLRWYLPAGIVNVKSYGAVGDGFSDDTSAIISAEAACAAGQVLFFPPGTYKVTSTITVTRQRACWKGSGPKQTVLSFGGASTTSDILVFGNGADQLIGAVLWDFRITSSVQKTAGYGLRFRKCGRLTLHGIVVEGQDGSAALGSSKLYHGVYFDEVDQTVWSDFEACASQTAVIVRGAVGVGLKAGLFLLNGKISNSNTGLHIAGAFGGTYINNVDIIFNNTCVLINEALSAEVNREVMFGDCSIDSAMNGQAVKIDCPSDMSWAWIRFVSTWIASSVGVGASPIGLGIWIKTAANASILLSGCRVYNHVRDGIRIDDASAYVFISDSFVEKNSGWGINPNVAGNRVMLGLNTFRSNTLGDVNYTNEPTERPECGFITARNIVVTHSIGLDDASTAWGFFGANSVFQFDTTDYILYDRTTNIFGFYIGGTRRAYVDTAGFHNG